MAGEKLALTASYWTLGGCGRPGLGGLPYEEWQRRRADLASRIGFAERVGAAAAAGFTSVGTTVAEYSHCRDRGMSDAEIRSVLTTASVTALEIEGIAGWASDDAAARARSRGLEETLYAAVEALGGVHHLNVGASGTDVPADTELLAERFGALCDRAAGHGLQVAIEFMPFTPIASAGAAWAIARTAGRPNGGVLLDVWHYFRGDPDPAALRAIPPERIIATQLGDGVYIGAPPTMEECLRYRRLPGEGEFDVVGVLRLLGEMGVDCPHGVEIFSDELCALPADEAARQVYAATERLFAATRA